MTLLPEVLILCALSILCLPLILGGWLAWTYRRKTLTWVAVLSVGVLLGLLATFMSSIAFGFPENVRHGYPSCSSCHVAPSGGGAVTAYGRGASQSIMSTWGRVGEEAIGQGIWEPPDWLEVGGDFRYINANLRGPGYDDHKKFAMQYDLELAFSPVKPITFVASYGYYGPDRIAEWRRNYLKLQISDMVSLRAGRFMPAYGIGFADHRLPTRAGLGLGEGDETYNIEAALISSFGEIFVAGVFGDETSVGLNDGAGYAVASDSRSGVVAKAALFLGPRSQLGASVMGLSSVDHYRQAFGPYVIVGITDSIYFLGEYDRRFEDGKTADLAAGRLGFEAWRGVHLSLIGDVEGLRHAAGAQFQWLPRPHWEFLAEAKRSILLDEAIDSGILMLHYYL